MKKGTAHGSGSSRSSLYTPEQILKTLNISRAPPNLPLHSNKNFLHGHPPLHPGERFIIQVDTVTCVETFERPLEGVLHCTTYRLIFTGTYVQGLAENNNEKHSDPHLLSRRGYRHNVKNKTGTFQFFDDPLSTTEQGKTISENRRQMGHAKSMKKRAASTLNLQDAGVSCQLISYKPNIASAKMVGTPDVDYDQVVSIPLASIYEIRKYLAKSYIKKDKLKRYTDGIEVFCSTLRSFRFCFSAYADYDADEVMKIFSKYLHPKNYSQMFAFPYKNSVFLPVSCNTWIDDKSGAPNFFKLEDELRRLGLMANGKDEWRTCEKQLCSSYPSKTIVPSTVTDVDLASVANSHRNRCYPVVCWRHLGNGAVMMRSSVTMRRRGRVECRNETDEQFVEMICKRNKEAPGAKLVVFTEHPRQSQSLLNSPQQMNKQLTADEGEAFYYPHCKFIYIENPPDFLAVRQSAQKLQTFLTNQNDDKYLSCLGDTQWLSQISELLETASLIAIAMDTDKSSVLVSYEDGFDRTCQLSSLAQLLLDPFYRTLDGFQILIQKEWLSFGHMFSKRTLPFMGDEEYGPIFIQWVDCVWQLVQQFPFSFEFNNVFLQDLVEHVYSCRFGTFLMNSEKERAQMDVEKATVSFWSYVNIMMMAQPVYYINEQFQKHKTKALSPQFHTPSLKLWISLYTSQPLEDNLVEAQKNAQGRVAKQEKEYARLLRRSLTLINKLSELDEKNVASVSTLSAKLQPYITKSVNEEKLSCFFDSSCLSESSFLESLSSSEQFSISSGDSQKGHPLKTMRSRSLDNLLESSTLQWSKKTSIKRKVGGSKFYIMGSRDKETFSQALAGLREVNEMSDRRVRMSEKYSGLLEYLENEGFQIFDEPNVHCTLTNCCGYLIKQGNVRKSWKERWFVLDITKKYLAYFKDKESDCPKGVIEYESILRVYPSEKQDRSNQMLFYIETRERTYPIRAPSLQCMNIWIACLTVDLSVLKTT